MRQGIFWMLVVAVAMAANNAAEEGKKHFETYCKACHRIGGGRLVGPDLKGVHKKYEEAWLIKWIKSSQSLIKAGDERAVKLFEENNKAVMPDTPLEEEQIKAILAYIAQASEQSQASSASVQTTQATAVVQEESSIDPAIARSMLSGIKITLGVLLFTALIAVAVAYFGLRQLP